MDGFGFTAGVRPGGLTDIFEVKVLICYLMQALDRPVSFAQLGEIIQLDGYVNYFSYTQAAAELKDSGHLKAIAREEEGEILCLTAIGKEMAVAFEKSLPYSVRDKAVKSAEQYYREKRLQMENNVVMKKVPDGYTITFTVTDIGTDLMSLTLFAPDRKECERMKEYFLKNPGLVYQGILSILADHP